MISFLKKEKIKFLIVAIVLIAFFFRFYNYQNRWGLAYDQARNALVALWAIRTHQIPLIGPFSASGPFVFGPYYYWFLIAEGILFSYNFFFLWIVRSVLSVFMVLFVIFVGSELGGVELGLLWGFFAAISTAVIGLSTNLIASSLVQTVSVFVVYFFAKAIKKPTFLNYFLLGLSVGFTINIHFQAIPLLLILPIAVFFSKPKIKSFPFLLLGFVFPFVPIAIFDAKTHFYESSNFIQYTLHPRGVEPKRWLTYLTDIWPNYWSDIIGGSKYLTYIIILISTIVTWSAWVRKQIENPIKGIVVGLIVIFLFLRYFQGVFFEDFIAFLHPFILAFTAWVCLMLLKKNKAAGIILIFLIAIFTVKASYSSITAATNLTALDSQLLVSKLKLYESHKNFAIYDYQYKTGKFSLPLVLYLDREKLTNSKGVKIGVANFSIPNYQIIDEEKKYYHVYLFNLNNISESKLKKAGWILVTPRTVYNSIEKWY